MTAVGHDRMQWMLNNPRPYWENLKDPLRGLDDLAGSLPFTTIPPGDGVTFERTVTWGDIFPRGFIVVPPNKAPRPGDKYHLEFIKPRSNQACLWWNWGDLGDELKDKRLMSSAYRRPDGTTTAGHENEVYSYGYNSERTDTEDNQLQLLTVHYDTTPHFVQFVE